MSHQVGAPHFHQIDTDSNLAPVLGLKPLSKSLRIYQGQQPPDGGPVFLCGGVKSEGKVMKVRPAKFIRLKQIKIWLCGGRALHRNSGTSVRGKNLPCPRATPLSLCHPMGLSGPP